MVALEAILAETRTAIEARIGTGKVADYIPALARVDPNNFGIAVVDLQGKVTTVGDEGGRFHIAAVGRAQPGDWVYCDEDGVLVA